MAVPQAAATSKRVHIYSFAVEPDELADLAAEGAVAKHPDKTWVRHDSRQGHWKVWKGSAPAPAFSGTVAQPWRLYIVLGDAEKGAQMADDKKYDEARKLAEGALKKTVEGDDKAAERLAQKANAADPQAVEDVLRELDEDASSEHDPEKIREDLGNDADKQ
jgi:hypothetical protein